MLCCWELDKHGKRCKHELEAMPWCCNRRAQYILQLFRGASQESCNQSAQPNQNSCECESKICGLDTAITRGVLVCLCAWAVAATSNATACVRKNQLTKNMFGHSYLSRLYGAIWKKHAALATAGRTVNVWPSKLYPQQSCWTLWTIVVHCGRRGSFLPFFF